jgi:alkylation response protein AidB-like acyl-CoA dehydrogenase
MINEELESIDTFRRRARTWIEQNLAKRSSHDEPAEDGELVRTRERELQRVIAEAGFAGIAVPTEYGGAGLTLDHQKVWAEETMGYRIPRGFMVSLGMMLPTLLDYGSESIKKRHIPRMLRGEEVWIQLLSEPSGGSDMAGVLTKATRLGDDYLLNGSKMWSSGADWADYGLCLARLDWSVPKHQGLVVLGVSLKARGVTIEPIRPVTGGLAHFFIEYFDEVVVPGEYLLGQTGEGWTVAQRLLFHERNATAGVGYGYGLGGGDSAGGSGWKTDIIELARRSGALTDPDLAMAVADDYIETVVASQLASRITAGMRSGKLQGHWGSLLKLGLGIETPINAELALAVTGADGVIWTGDGDGGEIGLNWLKSRIISIAGGSNEIQRNIVSERLLGLPREPGDDKNVPFNELMKQRSQKR